MFLPGLEYDFYHHGNVAYGGISDYILYGGYTWAWTHFHIGLITSPASKFLPFPYVYWRF